MSKQTIESWETRDNKANGKLALMNLVVSLCLCQKQWEARRWKPTRTSNKCKNKVGKHCRSNIFNDQLFSHRGVSKIKNYELCSFQINEAFFGASHNWTSLTFFSQINSGEWHSGMDFLAVRYPDSSHLIQPLKFCCVFLPVLPARPITAQFRGFETVQ